MRVKYIFIALVFLTFTGCMGEFTADKNAIIITRPLGLCEGGTPKANNTLEIPFEWSVDGEAGYTGFTIEVKNLSNPSSQPILKEVLDSSTMTTIVLPRGQNFEWKVTGQSNLGSKEASEDKGFFSESLPTEDNLPLPSKISIRYLQTAIEIIWSNDNEDIDDLSYDLLLSTRIASDENIPDVTKLNYNPIGNTRSESDAKRELITLSSIETGDYILQIRTSKTENGVTNSSNSFAKIKNN